MLNLKNSLFKSNLILFPKQFQSKSKNFMFSWKKFNFSTKVKLDPYMILELHRGAEFKEIKKAYFKLARQYHPDLNKNDEVRK